MQIKNYLLQILLTFVLLLTYCASPEEATEEVVGPDDSVLALEDSPGALEMELNQENSEEENFAVGDNEVEVQEEGELDSELMGEEEISEQNFVQEENEVAEQTQESESIEVVVGDQEPTGEELVSEEDFAPEGAVLEDSPAVEVTEESISSSDESEALAEQGSEEAQDGLEQSTESVVLVTQDQEQAGENFDSDSYEQEEEIDDEDSMEVADQGSDLQESQIETQEIPDQEVVATTTAPESGTFIEYVVQAGDSLSKIAQRVYQDKSEWKKIQAANAQFIDNPDAIFPGDVLRIPVESAPTTEEFVTEFKKSEPLSQDKVSVSVEKETV